MRAATSACGATSLISWAGNGTTTAAATPQSSWTDERAADRNTCRRFHLVPLSALERDRRASQRRGGALARRAQYSRDRGEPVRGSCTHLLQLGSVHHRSQNSRIPSMADEEHGS